jgi:predicted nucleic acid-binding protein
VKALFVDTAGWVACADAADPAHARCAAARDAALQAGHLLLTTDFVVDETLTLLRFRLGVPSARAWWQQVDASSRLRWERIDSDRFEKAREIFFQYRDKDFSFTDCTSFVVMHDTRVTHALTTDGHFRQMGFQVVPAPGRGTPRTRRRSV